MRNKIRYSGWLLALCAALGLMLSSCNRMEPAPSPDADAPAELVFSGSIDRWDLALTKAEGTEASWPDQSAVFCTLKSGDNTLMLRMMYNAGTDSWSMNRVVQYTNGFSWDSVSASDLAPFSSGTCGCYCFEAGNGNPVNYPWTDGDGNRPYVGLGGTYATYGDMEAIYNVADGQITIRARLAPLTGRIRFSSPDGWTGSWWGTLYGLRYCDRYDLLTGELTTSTRSIGIPTMSEEGQSPYYYGVFSNPEYKRLSVYSSLMNKGSMYYERVFFEDILAPGSSNVDSMPSSINHNEWYQYEWSVYRNFELRYVVPGTFQMGGDDAGPVHQVTLTKGYYLSTTEITRNTWYYVMGSPSSYNGSDLPVTGKTWDEVQEFIVALNAKSGYTYRLPTEAEWEYAARGGQSSNGYKYSGSDKCSDVAVRDGSGTVTAVQTKNQNEWGFYDMSGNASEWVYDWFGEYPDGPVVDPKGPDSGTVHVRRGGNRRQPESYLTVSYRDRTAELEMTGFRLAMDAPKIQ